MILCFVVRGLLNFFARDVEAGFLNPKDSLPPTLLVLLREVGRFYVPFMLANEQERQGCGR